jgi:hypothetical protein
VHVEKLVSVAKLATVLLVYTTEKHRCFAFFFLWAKGLDAKNIHKEMFPVGSESGGSVLVAVVSLMTRLKRRWGRLLRQQSKEFHAAGFDALVKRWNKCINVGGGYVEK